MGFAKTINAFINHLSNSLASIGNVVDRRRPGYYEQNFKFTVKDELINKWVQIGNPNGFLKRLHESYGYKFPYGNGKITVHRFDSIVKFRNWPHDNRWEDSGPITVRKSIKAVGKTDAIRQLNDINFLPKLIHCAPGFKKELEKILLTFKEDEFIIITHKKELI